MAHGDREGESQMKKLYWVAGIIGIALMPVAHKMATNQRGYAAFGGELLIIPLFMLVALLVDQMREMVMVIKAMEEKEKSQ